MGGPCDLSKLGAFRRVWLADFEFSQPPGARPSPVCSVALELRTGRVVREWLWGRRPPCPYDLGGDSLFVSYHVPAELTCHRALGWAMPAHVIDLCAEFKCQRNGVPTPVGKSLIGA